MADKRVRGPIMLWGVGSVATFGVSVWTVEGSKRPQRSHPDMNEASTS